MNKSEYEKWREWTLSTRDQWVVDPIHGKPYDCLMHIGGEDGKYIWIRGPHLMIGNYEMAIPHIGDAKFGLLAERTFTSNNAAWKYLLERSEIPALVILYHNKVNEKEELNGE